MDITPLILYIKFSKQQIKILPTRSDEEILFVYFCSASLRENFIFIISKLVLSSKTVLNKAFYVL